MQRTNINKAELFFTLRPKQHTYLQLHWTADKHASMWRKKWSWDAFEFLLPFCAASLVRWWQPWCTSSGLTVCCRTRSRRRLDFPAWRPFRPNGTGALILRRTRLYSTVRKLWVTDEGKTFTDELPFYLPSSLFLYPLSLTTPFPHFTLRQCFPLLLLESLHCAWE